MCRMNEYNSNAYHTTDLNAKSESIYFGDENVI